MCVLATHHVGAVQRRPQRLTFPQTSYVEDVQTGTEADETESRQEVFLLPHSCHFFLVKKVKHVMDKSR